MICTHENDAQVDNQNGSQSRRERVENVVDGQEQAN